VNSPARRRRRVDKDPVARPDDDLQQGDGGARVQQLLFRQGSSGVNSRVTRIARFSPGSVLRMLRRLLDQRGHVFWM
jgi:hypothetical protein